MAYSDYVQIYRVWDEAGIEETDDRAAQVSKIATWINANFSDIVTASAVDDVRVLVMDKEIHAGFWWGQPVQYSTDCPAASYPNNRGTVYYLDGSLHYVTSESVYYYWNTTYQNIYTIGSLGLLVCKATHGYVMDFIHLSTIGYGQQAKFIVTDGKVKGNGNETKCAIFGNLYSSGNYNRWGCIVKGYTTAGAYGWNQGDYFRFYNHSAQTTIMTKYNPVGSQLICSNMYAVNWVIPANNTIFEIGGTKYLSLNYDDFGGNCHGLAFKLD